VNGALLRHLARRYALGCAACAVAPVLIGMVLGLIWPEWKLQLQVAEKFGVMKVVQAFLRSDLVPSDSAAAFFQIAFMHPLTMLSLIVAMAMPTVAFPASARGRGTLDLLLATPLTRRELVVTTFLFTVPFALLHAAAPMLGTWIGGTLSSVADQLPFARFARVSVESAALALFFSGLSLFLSVRASDAGGAIRWLAIVVFWSLFAELVGTYWQRFQRLKWFTPFGWFEPPQVLAGTRPFDRDSLVLAGAGVLLALVAVAWEEKRSSA
jgi:hypothetical protein